MTHWSTKLVVVVIGLATAAAQACPMCKDSIPSSDAPVAGGVPVGLNASVYFMLAGLFMVLCLVSAVIVRGVRATDAANRAAVHTLRSHGYGGGSEG